MSQNEINLGLERILELLKILDNPHLKLPPTIHIAGTNGKGSTLSFLRSIFEEAGLKVHAYTSPHLVKFNERIILAGKEISDDFLAEVLDECKKIEINTTFFELTTAAAFLAFSRVEADILLLETGLGGRLDATNVLPQVLCSVITPIDFDHEEFLGNSLEKIAFEKAGIMKKNCPVIVGRQKEEALRVLENRALELGCEIKIMGRDFSSLPFPQLNLQLKGQHQLDNAAVATATALAQNQFFISEENIKNGLEKTFWPARLQKITSGKFFEKLPKNFELYLDGSHNLQGAKTVLEFLETQKNKNIFVIFGMLKNKNCDGFLKVIAKKINQLIAIEIPDEANSFKPSEITKIARENEVDAIEAENFLDAFEKIKCEEESIVLVCGSLYLAGEFLKENIT